MALFSTVCRILVMCQTYAPRVGDKKENGTDVVVAFHALISQEVFESSQKSAYVPEP